MATVKHITTTRHNVNLYIGVKRDLDWLKSQLITYEANNIWYRYKRFLALLEKQHPGALDIKTAMEKRSKEWNHVGDLDPLSFSAYIDRVLLMNTYLRMGAGGVYTPVRHKRVKKVIERARNLTLGSDDIGWFLEAVGERLSKHVDDRHCVELSLTTTFIQETGDFVQTIECDVVAKPPKKKS